MPSVAASASTSSQPTISTRPSATSWTTPRRARPRPSGPRRDRRRRRGRPGPGARAGHAATSGRSIGRTGSPAAAIAALTASIETSRRWKIPAASTASAPPSTHRGDEVGGAGGAARRDDRHPDARRDRARGARCRSRTSSRRGRSRSRAARPRRARPRARAHATASRPAGSRPPLTTTSKPDGTSGVPSGTRRASIATTTACEPNRAAQRGHEPGIGDGPRVEADLVGARAEHVAHVVDATARRRRR